MTKVQGRVGTQTIHWDSIPRGFSGSAQLHTEDGERYTVHWKKDSHGIWLELPDGVYGFDFQGSHDEEGRKVFEVSQRFQQGYWVGLSFLKSGEEHIASQEKSARKGLRLRAQMPGKVLRILVAVGTEIDKDQPLLVMEAMKMENEIRAPHSGKLVKIYVSEGQSIETGTELMILEST